MIFETNLMLELEENEKVEADDGCIGEDLRYIRHPKSFVKYDEHKLMASRVRNRQETVKNRFKCKRIL